MFKRAIFAAFALIACAAFAIYHFHLRSRSTDWPAYNTLVQESTELRTRHALQEQPAHQSRRGVQKDIWTQNETRYVQIESQHSHLTLSQNKEKTEALEELKQIRCSLPGSVILTADEGTYAFPSHQFIAQNNCRLVQGSNYIDGARIHLDLAQETVTYQQPCGYLAPFHFTADTLIWNKKENKIHLVDHVIIRHPDPLLLEADHATLTFDDLQPTLFVLEGNVHLLSSHFQGKESYALSDTLTYTPSDRSFLFSSARKVLFWQEGLSLSASQVLVRPDHTVEGHGDVHFSFDLEEQNSIDQLFKRYL